MDTKMKRGQVTLFIILAIVIVVAIVALFLLLGDGGSETPTGSDPRSFVQECVKESLEDNVQEVMENGGVLDSTQALRYDNENYTYLCYQADYYLPCYNIRPMLEEKIEKDLREKTKNEVQACFNALKEDMESRGYSLQGGPTNYSIDLIQGQISVTLVKKVDYSKGDSTQSIKDFSFEILSPLFSFASLAREIVNEESTNCNFDYNSHMLLHPDSKIMRIDYDGNKIYKIFDKDTGAEFKFAVRSCVFPAGI